MSQTVATRLTVDSWPAAQRIAAEGLRRIVVMMLLLGPCWAALTAKGSAQEAIEPWASDEEAIAFFEDQVRPILVEHCYECHSQQAGTLEGGLSLETREGWQRGGELGTAIKPGEPNESWLIRAVRPYDDALQMPPESRLNEAQIATLEQWVARGAIDPRTDGSQSTKPRAVDLAAGREFWSFRSVDAATRDVVNQMQANAWGDGPYRPETRIDWAIQSQWQARGIEPVARAEAAELLRRVSLDLVGLPPTADEVDRFANDSRPDALQRQVDRLLASPRYGERWGRHWLDVARYADSNGMDENIAHGNAWRYRDWVVSAWNSDLPFDEFIQWQLAGDLLPSTDQESIRIERTIATGFLSLGPKVLAEVDETKMELDIVDEQVETVGRAMLGMTFGCARCHDHKFDPIRTHDYYALAGIFKSTRTMEHFTKIAKWHELPIETAAEKANREAMEAELAAKEARIAELVAVADQELQKELGEGVTLPEDKETRYAEATRAELASLRVVAADLKARKPVAATAMAVVDYPEAIDLPVHIRGSHLTLGEVVARDIPAVFHQAQAVSQSDAAASDERLVNLVEAEPSRGITIADSRSGRLELARWMASPENPLTDRVIVNRIWRWHFGRGIVPSTDNFGVLGERPTHPELLDDLVLNFRDHEHSLKWLHRYLISSAVYQRSSHDHPRNRELDPSEISVWRFRARRMEAETIRDSMLAVAQRLDYRIGGSLLHVGNREFLFDHTSKDATKYDAPVRSLYLPVIRNHMYDLFGLFDYNDAAVPLGDRPATVVPNQALFLLNAPLVNDLASQLSQQSQRETAGDSLQRVSWLYRQVLGREPREAEREKVLSVVSRDSDAEQQELRWALVAQALLISNEFLYVP